MKLADAIEYISDYKAKNPHADKAAVQQAFVDWCSPMRVRSVLVSKGFCLRFSQASGNGFSNTVLSLSALQSHDTKPFVVALVRENDVKFFLANTTFLKKISHSSHQLRLDNIKGSFNGSDIMSEYEGIENSPNNFEILFAQHSAFTWEENLERLVEATNAIVGYDRRFRPSNEQLDVLWEAPNRAKASLVDPNFNAIENELVGQVNALAGEILNAASIDNVNLRGNAIEQLLTRGGNAHELGDLKYNIGDGKRLVVDIKTKLIDRASAPKAYNIDKMLSFLSEPNSYFAFLIIIVNLSEQTVTARLLSIFDTALLQATGVQYHWAGRTSRGVTQLSGRFGRAGTVDYLPSIDLAESERFLKKLLEI